ncbi:MAG: carboxypeptidase-like regulatory domain-containing protein, partial [Chitinophagales bacterium]
MKRIFFAAITAFIFFSNHLFAQDNTIIEISGRVTDQEKQQPLPDVSVQVKGTVTGAVTNASGNFVLRTKIKLPFTLVFTSIGFKPQELEVKSLGSNLQVALV